MAKKCPVPVSGWTMVNAIMAPPLGDAIELSEEMVVDAYRVMTRRGCCWARRPTGAGGVGGPNSRSNNDGPE